MRDAEETDIDRGVRLVRGYVQSYNNVSRVGDI